MLELGEFAPAGSEEARLLSQLGADRLPRHVAIIMDGNGRWARRRRLPRVAGHRAGIDAVRQTVEVCARLGIGVLTLYAFSQENWKRPRSEVDFLMELLKEFVRKEVRTLEKNDIRFGVIGREADLAPSVREELRLTLEATKDNGGLLFQVALSYGGRAEIIDACRALIRDGVRPEDVDEHAIGARLYTAGLPDPDLLIRTSGEMRVSNFLLWQIAYAELWVTSTLWPDFRAKDLLQALVDYQGRERRYGGLGSLPEGPERATAARG